MSPTTVTGALLGAAPDQARPLLTYYHLGTGERTELSGATLGNWASKIANFLRDEIGLLPGDTVTVDLPEHWQTAAILLGTWWAGGCVNPTASDDARVTFTTAARVDAHPDADELVAVPLDAFALGGGGALPMGVADFGGAVRVHGDRFTPGASGPAALPGITPAEVIAVARGAAAGAGIGSGDRVVSVRPWHDADGIIEHFLAPLLAGASLVWVGGDPGDARLAALADTEKATYVLGPPTA